jgi:hypothetical protein
MFPIVGRSRKLRKRVYANGRACGRSKGEVLRRFSFLDPFRGRNDAQAGIALGHWYLVNKAAIFAKIRSQRGKNEKMRRLATMWLAAGAMFCASMLLQPAPARAGTFDVGSLSGNFGFQLNKFGWCNNIVTSVGLLNFDGSGNVSASFTNYYSNKAGNGPKVKTGSASGTYTFNVNGDGTGEIDFSAPDNRTFAFVIDSTGSTGMERIEIIATKSQSSRCAMSGYAIQQ